MMPEEKKRRRSRVLEHFEKLEAKETPEGGGDDPFQGIDTAFGLDGSVTKGDK